MSVSNVCELPSNISLLIIKQLGNYECINPNCSQKKQSAIKHIRHADTLIYKPNEDHMASTIAPTLNIITMLVNGEQFLFWKTNVVKNNYTSPWTRVVCIT